MFTGGLRSPPSTEDIIFEDLIHQRRQQHSRQPTTITKKLKNIKVYIYKLIRG